jgi:hypothetical protein
MHVIRSLEAEIIDDGEAAEVMVVEAPGHAVGP